jgi:hypothetical protein
MRIRRTKKLSTYSVAEAICSDVAALCSRRSSKWRSSG